MNALAVNLAGFALIALIAWWFGLSWPRVQKAAAGVVAIEVKDGVYRPARIEVRAGERVVLRFLRRDPNPCAALVIFPDIGFSAELPLEKPTEVSVTPPRPGEYVYTCEMGMYRGVLVAV